MSSNAKLPNSPVLLRTLPTFKDHYYYLSAQHSINHTAANRRCQQLGGYLLEVNDL